MKNHEPELFQHYRVLRRPGDGKLWELGRGAMGVTYKAVDTRLHVNVALKIIHERLLLEEVARERFLREARAAASLRHRNVASVFHLGEYENNYFYVMEFVEGETLEALVERGGPLSVIDALSIVLQVSRALISGHSKKLVHRDIKPSNVMLTDEVDESAVVKLIDFGLAKSVVDAAGASLSDVNTSGFLGTPRYASPEQCDERPLDIRSDIYSLGATLWFLLTGQPPFTGSIGQVFAQHLSKLPPFEKLPEHIPADVHALLGRMLEKNPPDRQATPSVLRREIEACLRAAPASGLVVPLSTLEIHPHTGDTSAALAAAAADLLSPENPADQSLTGLPAAPLEAPLAEAFAGATAAADLPDARADSPGTSVLPETPSAVSADAVAAEEAIPEAEEPELAVPGIESPDSAAARPATVSAATNNVRAATSSTTSSAPLGDRYRLHRFLGEDEIGRLFLAESTTTKSEWVTARIFHSEIVESSPEAVPELQSAYERLQSSPHPNILELRDLETEGTPRFLITAASARDFSLLDILRQRGSLSTSETIHLARNAAAGVEHLHAHAGGSLDLSPRSLLVRLRGGANSASFPDPTDNRLLSEPVEQWSDFSLKLDPLPTILPARWREAGSASTWGGTRMLTSSRPAAGRAAAYRCSPTRAMALLCYELLAGELPTGLHDPVDRRGHFPPLPRLNDSANELLQRALGDEFPSASATDFCEEFAAAQAAVIRPEAPPVNVAETLAPLPEVAEPDAGVEEALLIDAPEVSAFVPGLTGHEDEVDVPPVAPEPPPAPVPILRAPVADVVRSEPVVERSRRFPLVPAAAGAVFLVAAVAVGLSMHARRDQPAPAAATVPVAVVPVTPAPVEPSRPVVSAPTPPAIAASVQTPELPVQTPTPAPVVAETSVALPPEASPTPALETPTATAEPTKPAQTAANRPTPGPAHLQVVDNPPPPPRETPSHESTPRPARQAQQEVTHTRTHIEPTSSTTTQRQRASESSATTTSRAPASTTTSRTSAPTTVAPSRSSGSQNRNVDVFRGSAPGG